MLWNRSQRKLQGCPHYVCVCVCVCVYMYVCMYVRMYVCMYVCMYCIASTAADATGMPAARMRHRLCRLRRLCVCVCVCVCARACVCVVLLWCLYVCMYVCMYIMLRYVLPTASIPGCVVAAILARLPSSAAAFRVFHERRTSKAVVQRI
jgi:hypothetical protein